MTNCDYTRQAVKTDKDLIICKKKFQGITKDEWLRMCYKEGYQIKDEVNQKEEEKAPQKEEEKKIIIKAKPKTVEELRKLRLAYYDKKNII
jgi:DNA-binding winged helix-turn-helix (wHTH) protein